MEVLVWVLSLIAIINSVTCIALCVMVQKETTNV